jgi:hypothetical protein
MTNITKLSGIVAVKENGNLPKSYYNITAKFSTIVASSMFIITLDRDTYELQLSNLQVNGVNPSTMSQGISLLSALFAV